LLVRKITPQTLKNSRITQTNTEIAGSARFFSSLLELLIDFEMALSERKRKYPAQEFFAFASATRRYIDLTRKDQLVRRDVAVALKGLAACLEVMRKGVPDAVVLEAHRLESLFFDGYDPYFEGDEPSGL